jgi:glycosyltransferase involved in cell wall biosynthesis
MNILIVNKFLYPKGGADKCAVETYKLLSDKGHSVVLWGMKHSENPKYPYSDYFVNNVDYNVGLSTAQKISYALKILYSFEAKHKIDSLINKIGIPDLVHLHNFAHQISPSILSIFKKYRIPVVMTLHDYKLVCPSYALLADGKPCEACAGGNYWHCLTRACVKNSKAKSMLSTFEMILHHKILDIYRSIDLFISPSYFLKNKFHQMGFRGRIEVLPNFIEVDSYAPEYLTNSNTICYVGRLSKEKGLADLVKSVNGLDVELKLIGDGPIRGELEHLVAHKGISNVKFLGHCCGDILKNEITKTLFVVIPSVCYENYPYSAIEAFALGKPVVASRIGGIPELVKDGQTGMTFNPDDEHDLRRKIVYMLNNKDEIIRMGKTARAFVETTCNSNNYYKGLMDIYGRLVLERNKNI